jgi:HAD superfamily hydrolase (TIGR01509 family)
MTLKAVLWDVDGTLAETERDGHRVAFNRAFIACGLPWHWSEERYGVLLAVTGGRERLLRDMADRPDAPPHAAPRADLARRLHATKNEIYHDVVRLTHLPLREGVLDLIHECRAAGVRLGIATTTSRSNVDALMRLHLGERWRHEFDALVCGEDVRRKKPDPEVYVRALLQLRLSPGQAVAIEDSPAGVGAARALGLPVIVTRSHYFGNEATPGALAIGPSLDRRDGWEPAVDTSDGAANGEEASARARGIGLADIEHWLAAAAANQPSRVSEGPSSTAHGWAAGSP